MRHARHKTLLRLARLLLSVGIPLALLLLLYRDSYPGVLAEPTQSVRQGGYGISVAATVGPRPDLLDALNMDWVYIYDTNQLESYPDQYVLYRIDLTNWPADAWVQGLPALAKVLRQADVNAVSIGNEPNLTEEWGNGKPNAKNYTQALCAAYKVFKQVAPQIVVVSAGLAPTAGTPDGMNINDLDFAQQMLNAGAANCFDAWGYHPYGFDQPPEADPHQHPFSFRRAELMEQVLQNNGVLGKQMWMTEWGWVRNPAEDGLNCATNEAFNRFTWMAVSAQAQADYTVRAFRFADLNWPWAGPMFLWNLNWSQISNLDQEPQCSHLRFYSIIGANGQPLPVFFSLQRVIPPHPPRVHTNQPGGQPAPQPGTEPGGPQAGVRIPPRSRGGCTSPGGQRGSGLRRSDTPGQLHRV